MSEAPPHLLQCLREDRNGQALLGKPVLHFTNVADPEEWVDFVDLLRQELLWTKPCAQSPKLPPRVPAEPIRRNELLNEAVQLVLAPAIQSPLALVSAVDGAGGSGTSTLAALLCQRPEVLEAFPDGIFWVKLGPQPDALQELQELHAAITGQKLPRQENGFINANDVVNSLAGRDNSSGQLADRRLLIVIDDARELADVVPFLEGGMSCVRVVTTPSQKLAQEIGARCIRVGAYSPGESAQLLPGSGAAKVSAASQLCGFAFCLGRQSVCLRGGVHPFHQDSNRG